MDRSRLEKIGLLVQGLVLGLLLGGQYGRTLGMRSEYRVTTTRLSPDETWLARVVEVDPDDAGDRQAAVQVQNRLTGRWDLVLSAGFDAIGRPAGTERIIWSQDGSKFLLVGRHFFVARDLMLAGGDEAYLLYEVATRQAWVNSEANHNFPPLTAEVLAAVAFAEPVVLRPRIRVDPDSPGKRE